MRADRVRPRLARTPRTRTLRSRVSLLALAVIGAWLVVLAIGLDVVLASRLDNQVEDNLRVRAQAASATVVVQDGRVTGVRESATDNELDSSIWVFAGRQAISRPTAGAPLQRAADELADSAARFVERRDHRFLVLPVTVRGHRVGTVVAATDLDPYERTRDTAIVATIVVGVLLILGAYPVLRFATGRALRPVDRMTRQAAAWGVSDPDERFGGHQRYVELDSLAGSLDELLARLAALLRHERHLSAELSHELRTPLARVATQIDLMFDAATDEQRAELRRVRADCAAMDGIIDTVMAAARSEFTTDVGRCALADVLAGFADVDGRPAVRVEPTSLFAGVDADLVSRALSPVVENARRHAARVVDLRTRHRDGVVEIDVVNDGTPIDDELVDRVFEAGFSSREDGYAGAGLGLSLARRLARSADGEVRVVPGAARTTFRLTLPVG